MEGITQSGTARQELQCHPLLQHGRWHSPSRNADPFFLGASVPEMEILMKATHDRTVFFDTMQNSQGSSSKLFSTRCRSLSGKSIVLQLMGVGGSDTKMQETREGEAWLALRPGSPDCLQAAPCLVLWTTEQTNSHYSQSWFKMSFYFYH